MGDERLERLGEPQFLERGRTKVGQNATVLALKGLDLGLDRARRRSSSRIVADLFRQRRGAGAQTEQMRPEFVVEFVGDHLTFLVVSGENPFGQLAVVALQIAKPLREAVDLGVEIARISGGPPASARAP